jgi:uncharacterized membrane protein
VALTSATATPTFHLAAKARRSEESRIMADLQVEGPGTTGNPPVNAATLVYVLFAIAVIGTLISHGLIVFAPLVGVAGIVGVIIAYVKRSDAQGTWVASHFTWLIRTFWWSLLWDIIGGLILVTLGLILIGIPIAIAIFVATSIWGIYRLIRGFLYFKDSQAVPGV